METYPFAVPPVPDQQERTDGNLRDHWIHLGLRGDLGVVVGTGEEVRNRLLVGDEVDALNVRGETLTATNTLLIATEDHLPQGVCGTRRPESRIVEGVPAHARALSHHQEGDTAIESQVL